MRRLHVQVVHRHGDRSPITPLQNERYWETEVQAAAQQLQTLSPHFHVVTDDVVKSHKANGRGPFGKLTQTGLQQMIQLGQTLRQALFPENTRANHTRTDDVGDSSEHPESVTDCDKTITTIDPYIRKTPPTSLDVQVISTSFTRAIESAQGVIDGLLALTETSSINNNQNNKVDNNVPKIFIDARHTVRLLPDPQPRETVEQAMLEDVLATRPHLQMVEEELLPLAVRVSTVLRPLLAADAHEAVFGAKQVLSHASDESIEEVPLAWNQLAEIIKCLAIRKNMLPTGITSDDLHQVVQHAAWRWFESFRHPRLAYLGMHEQVQHMLHVCQTFVQNYVLQYQRNNQSGKSTRITPPPPPPPPLVLYSAHDSTLIGLLCALKLEQPVAWPEYGSYLMMELWQVVVPEDIPQEDNPHTDNAEQDIYSTFYLQFSLNGKLLRSCWEGSDNPMDMIRLDRLMELYAQEDEATKGLTATAADYRWYQPHVYQES
jgi:acid phosphatase